MAVRSFAIGQSQRNTNGIAADTVTYCQRTSLCAAQMKCAGEYTRGRALQDDIVIQPVRVYVHIPHRAHSGIQHPFFLGHAEWTKPERAAVSRPEASGLQHSYSSAQQIDDRLIVRHGTEQTLAFHSFRAGNWSLYAQWTDAQDGMTLIDADVVTPTLTPCQSCMRPKQLAVRRKITNASIHSPARQSQAGNIRMGQIQQGFEQGDVG